MSPQPRYNRGDKIGGRYLVHKALMGGMGEVYLCLELEHSLPIALKTFQPRALENPKLRTSFEREVGIWVALEKHSNIVRCFYLDTVDHLPFMFLEWVAETQGRGTSLRDWLRRGPLMPRQALDFVIDICRGLIHAGQKQPGIVHRDLKPENVLLAPGPLAKITDFGLAKIVQEAELVMPDMASSACQHLTAFGGTPPPLTWYLNSGEENPWTCARISTASAVSSMRC